MNSIRAGLNRYKGIRYIQTAITMAMPIYAYTGFDLFNHFMKEGD
jgi:hypothetical protein